MDRAEGWFMCRVGFVETVRAVSLSAGQAAATTVREEWPAFGVIEVDQRLAENAAKLAIAASCAASTLRISLRLSCSHATISSSPHGTADSTRPPRPKDSPSSQKGSTDGSVS